MKFISNVMNSMKKKKTTIRNSSEGTGLFTSTINKARQNEGIPECRLSTLGYIADALGVKAKRLFDEAEGEGNEKVKSRSQPQGRLDYGCLN